MTVMLMRGCKNENLIFFWVGLRSWDNGWVTAALGRRRHGFEYVRVYPMAFEK